MSTLTQTPCVTGIAPQFLVDDLDRAVAYYRNKLGFQLDAARHQGGLSCVEYLHQQRVDVGCLKLRPRAASRIEHRANDLSNSLDLACYYVQPLGHPLVVGAGAQKLYVARDQVERGADFVRKLRGELAGRRKPLELGQLSLQLEQSQVGFFELLLALGDLRCRVLHSFFEALLIEVQLLGHVPYSPEHSIEAGSQEADFVRERRLYCD